MHIINTVEFFIDFGYLFVENNTKKTEKLRIGFILLGLFYFAWQFHFHSLSHNDEDNNQLINIIGSSFRSPNAQRNTER